MKRGLGVPGRLHIGSDETAGFKVFYSGLFAGDALCARRERRQSTAELTADYLRREGVLPEDWGVWELLPF